MKDDRVYLRHILRYIARIDEYTTEGRDTFFASPYRHKEVSAVAAIWHMLQCHMSGARG